MDSWRLSRPTSCSSNKNLERYADYDNRLERGRSYVRHSAVLDLKISDGRVSATVLGSSSKPYKIKIRIDKLSESKWEKIRKNHSGCLDSLSALLGGEFPQELKDVFFKDNAGLFPGPDDIHLDCSCYDYAEMCKHVAAAMYGVGARLDEDPSLFFTLRDIHVDDLIASAVEDTTKTLLGKADRKSDKVLSDADLGDVFGIEFDDVEVSVPSSISPLVIKSSMLEILSASVSKKKKGTSVRELQEDLGWSETQIRNTITRAHAQEKIERISRGVYRRRV